MYALAALAAWSLSAAQPSKANEHHAVMEQCAKACTDCMRACNTCERHCLEMVAQGKKEHKDTVLSCGDCAAVCAVAAKIVGKGGPYAAQICDACAKVCEQCAIACEKHPQDEHMKQCAKACRDCQKACQDMVAHAGK